MTLCPKSELFSEDVSIVALGDLVENLAQEEVPYEFAYERIGHPWPFWSLIPTRFLARGRREQIFVYLYQFSANAISSAGDESNAISLQPYCVSFFIYPK